MGKQAIINKDQDVGQDNIEEEFYLLRLCHQTTCRCIRATCPRQGTDLSEFVDLCLEGPELHLVPGGPEAVGRALVGQVEEDVVRLDCSDDIYVIGSQTRDEDR